MDLRGDEARVLAVRYNALGKRHREFRECIEKGSETKWVDWGITGPRMALWVARYCLENGGTPLTMHTQWRNNAKLTQADAASCFMKRHAKHFRPPPCMTS